jgi:hypothetical protein
MPYISILQQKCRYRVVIIGSVILIAKSVKANALYNYIVINYVATVS